MKIIYVAGKFAGANGWEIWKNICRAEHTGMAVAEAGAMPLIPHMNTAHFVGTLREEFWYEGTLELLKHCDAMVLVPGWEDSKGTAKEVEWAKMVKMPIFERVDALKEWLKTCDEPDAADETGECVVCGNVGGVSCELVSSDPAVCSVCVNISLHIKEVCQMDPRVLEVFK